MTAKKLSNPHFVVYDGDHSLRKQLDAVAKERDLSRGQLVRHALKFYLRETRY